MAKKTIISDFSALKGKISFSEHASGTDKSNNSPATKTPKNRDIKPDSKTSERLLKVGQKVIMMDSDHKGTIISLGKTVCIELEDGLKIHAGYGEFAVTDQKERTALKDGKINIKWSSHQTQKPKVSSNSGTLTVDLHIEAISGGRSVPKGQHLEFQMATFKKAIQDNLSHRGLKICFIHGNGEGILKAAIRKELDEVLALRCSYSVGDPAVTIVTIK